MSTSTKIAATGIAFAGILLSGMHPSALPESCPALRGQIEHAHESARAWLFHNLDPATGFFIYAYNPFSNKHSEDNNAIRQLMASRILAEAGKNDAALQPLHKQNLSAIMNAWYREKSEIGYVYFDEKSKLGANAMLLRTLVASPFFDTYQQEARALANGILTLQHENGSFAPWFIEPAYEFDEAYLLTFYSGEALLALVEYFQKTGDRKYLHAAEKSADFYIDRYVTHMQEHYYPAYVPWHTIALFKLNALAPRPKYVRAIFAMNDKLLELQDTTEHIGRFYNPATPQYGSPHTSSDAVYTEGLAYAYDLAQQTGDVTRAKQYRNALTRSVDNLSSLQYRVPIPNVTTSPLSYVGAFRVRDNSGWIRIDTAQHAIDAYKKMLDTYTCNNWEDARRI